MARFSRSNQDGTPVELNSRRLRQAQQCMRQARDEKQILLPPCGIRMTDVAMLGCGEAAQGGGRRAVPVLPKSPAGHVAAERKAAAFKNKAALPGSE